MNIQSMQQTALYALQRQLEQFDRAAQQLVESAESASPELVAAGVVALDQAVHGVKAQTTVIRTESELLGDLLDVLA